MLDHFKRCINHDESVMDLILEFLFNVHVIQTLILAIYKSIPDHLWDNYDDRSQSTGAVTTDKMIDF